MDVASWSKKITGFIKKYKYAVLVLFIGIGLMMVPEDMLRKEPAVEQTVSQEPVGMNERLAEILSQIDGAGSVNVLLTVRAGEETLYHTDCDSVVSDSSTSTQTTVVTVTTSGKEETGLVRQINPPQYLGAIIVCQGGDSPSVRLAIIDAVSKVTGLNSDRISVLKMK